MMRRYGQICLIIGHAQKWSERPISVEYRRCYPSLVGSVLSPFVGLEAPPIDQDGRDIDEPAYLRPRRSPSPSLSQLPRWRSPADALAVSSFVGTAAGLLVLVRRGIPDDAFIYLRYAENLHLGNGWAFNVGHPSDAATSPAYTLFLAITRGLGIGGPTALLLTFGLGMVAMAVGLYFGLRENGRLTAWAVALTALAWPGLLHVVGLETSFFAAAVVLAALAYDRRWMWTAGLAAGVAALGRPEGLVVALLLAGIEIVRRDGRLYKIVIPTLLLLLPWKLFEWVSFGTLIPHSLQVKAFQGSLNSQHWISAFFDQIPLPAVVLPLAAVGTAVAAVQFRRGRPFSLVVIAVGLLQVLAYTALNAPSWYQWYFEPGNLAMILAAGLGLHWAVRTAASRIADRQTGGGAPRTTWVPLAGLLVVVFGATLSWQRLPVPGQPSSLTSPFRLSDSYLRVASWLRAHSPPGAWVATGKIGYLGYYSGLNVLDTMGLADQQSVPMLSKDPWFWWFATRPAPLFVVVHVPAWPGEPEPPGASAAWPGPEYHRFLQDYVPVFVTDPPASAAPDGVREMVVYERRPQPR